jgi:hypothetical protein
MLLLVTLSITPPTLIDSDLVAATNAAERLACVDARLRFTVPAGLALWELVADVLLGDAFGVPCECARASWYGRHNWAAKAKPKNAFILIAKLTPFVQCFTGR